ncbi:MAG: T9SS type A sorting domain-containing protein [Bacteroidales bacterium]|nr:T9SS type A sorting domain-containing protein [Bacteroidales bacterium]
MKNKILPLSLVTLVICLGAFFISATTTFPESYLNDPDNHASEAEKALFSNYLTKIRANQNTQIVDPADVFKAYKDASQKAEDAYMEDFNWYFLGPDNAGGFTPAILYDNTDETSKTIIAGALTGGLYKSTNGGLTWNKINGIENNLKVSCITQANDGTIYAGTGGLLMGSGIYKSTDSDNFALIPSTNPYAQGGNEAFAQINRIAVAADGTIFASTDAGIWYSADGGAAWNAAQSDGTSLLGYSTDVNVGSNGIVAASMEGLCYISANGNPDNFALHSSDTFNLPFEDVANLELAIAPSNPDILYATVLDDNDELVNIYRSDNQGVNWRIVGPGNSPTLGIVFTPENNVITVFPENPDKILVGGNNMWEGTKLSETGYFQWVQKSIGSVPQQITPSYLHTWHFEYVFRPGTSNQFLVGHNGGISRGSINSINIEFVELNKTYITSQAMQIGIGGFPKVVFGGFDQNGVQFIDGTVTPDLAKNGNQILGPAPPYGGNGNEVFISVIDPEVMICSQQNGIFYRSEDLGENFSISFLSSEISFPTDYLAPAAYWESFENEDSRDSVALLVTNTIPAGTEIWVNSKNRAYPFKHTAETTYNPGDSILIKDPISSKLFIGSEKALWMTSSILDFTQEPEWFQISNFTQAGLDGIVSSIGMSKDANFVFVGTEEGRFYRIANIALAYNYDRADVRSPFCIISTAEIPVIDPSTQAQNTQWVTSVAVDPQDPNHVIITMGNYGNNHYVYRSTNALSANPSFSSIQGDLPKMPVYSSIIEMNNSNMCIIGTENGIYESQNIGAATPAWTLSFGITGQVPVMDLKQQLIAKQEVTLWFWDGVDTTYVTYPGTYNFGNIYAATYGRGLYFSNKYQQPVGISSNDLPQQKAGIKVYPNPVRNSANIEYTLDNQSEIMINVFNISGKLVSSENITQSAGKHQHRLDCSALPNGMYVVSIQTGETVKTSKFIISH